MDQEGQENPVEEQVVGGDVVEEQVVEGEGQQDYPEAQESFIQLPMDLKEDRSMSMEAVSSAAMTPAGSPTADVSRAGRKRKANTRYMEEPSPVLKPVVRKSITKKPAAPPSPKSKSSSVPEPVKKAKAEESSEAQITGPPTFSSLLFGKKGARKLSESLSDMDLEEELPDIVSEEEEEEEPQMIAPEVKPETPVPAVGGIIGSGQKLAGQYVASGAVGRTQETVIKVPLVPPTDECSIKFPDLTTEEFQASLASRVVVPVEFAGGEVWSLIPTAPIHWFRDEVPKLSAYFRKKMEATGGIVPRPAAAAAAPASADRKLPPLTAVQREERRRQKEEERRKLIEERNRRRERERLKQLYRQHWLALTKFPIEDDLLHSHKGIRRLGHPPAQCRQVANPVIFWDCRMGPPGTLEVPESISAKSTELLDELFVIWSFFVHFDSLVGNGKTRFTLPELVEAVFSKKLTPLMSDVFSSLLEFLRPWTENHITTLLQAEQALESQLTKNRGRAKMYWSSICQFRDFLFLGYSTMVKRVGDGGSTNWLWEALFVAKASVLLESIDYKTKEFLPTIAAAFEEIDFEHKWIFEWEIDKSWTFEQCPFEYRVRLLKLLVDRIVSLPVVKKAVDLWCDSRGHVMSEVTAIEKEERKMAQKITLCQKLQSLMAQAPAGEMSNIQIPLTEQELEQEIAVRDALVRAKKTGLNLNDFESAVRLEVIGRDRHMNEYFQVSCDRRLVFVRQHSVSHPNVIRYGIYDSLSNIEQLIQSLDDRGVRELGLKMELQKIKANLFQDLSNRGISDFTAPSMDWLGDGPDPFAHFPDLEGEVAELDRDAKKFHQLKFLKECVDLTRNGFDRIRKAWRGRGPHSTEDEDDVTIDEEEEELAASQEMVDSTPTDVEMSEFVGEIEAFYASISALAETITECIRNSFLGFPRMDETTATTSSILIQFHIKTGAELLRHLSVPVDKNEFNRLLSSVDPSSRKSMVQVASVFLDGLEALDEIVHDEIARHEATSASIEIWPANGGEKHAWKRFITSRAETAQSEVPSPSGEEDQTPEETEEEQQQSAATTANWFSCEGCGKKFRFHILLGVHKLHPCKTRGRKPLPVDPIMEVLPVPSNNGMLAIERVGNVEFPPLPSTRQEAAEKAEKAEKAAAAAAAAALTESPVENVTTSTGTAEYVCDICGKVFPHNQGLAVHQTRWCIPEQQQLLLLSAQQAVGGGPTATTEEGPVNCPTCGKMFPTAQGLAIHQTRWCRGPEGSVDMDEDQRKVVGEQSSVIHVNPIFRPVAVGAEDLIKIEEISEASEHREPGVTPACYSLAGLSVAILWYRNKIETALSKFNSDKVHRSASARTSRR